jgi:predicted DNA-binding protein (MmcQ/YjbR family)
MATRRTDPLLEKIKAIVFALPDTKLTMTWGKPHFRVGEKIFCGYGEEEGRAVLGFKLELAEAAKLCKKPGYWPAPYVGHKGWVSMDVSKVEDWELVRGYIAESYRLIAPKRSQAKLAAAAPIKAKKKKAPQRKTARKTPARSNQRTPSSS